jgi:hypothetical protein
MASTPFRRLIAAVMMAAQLAALALATSPLAMAAPCPVHLSASGLGDHGAGHERHAAAAPDHGQATPVLPDEGDRYSGAFDFACCAAHMIGIIAVSPAAAASIRNARPASDLAQAMAPAPLSSVDPPPRSCA